MKIAVIGTGNTGAALARAMAVVHDAWIIGARDPSKAAALAMSIGSNVESGDIAAAIKAAEVVVLALPYQAKLDVIQAVDVSHKIQVDVSHPITEDFTGLVVGHTTSAAEERRARAPSTRVVKAFNTIFSSLLPSEAGGRSELQAFLASADAEAKTTVEHPVKAIGSEPIDAGRLSHSRFLKPMGEMNIQFGFDLGWDTVAAPLWRRV